MAELVSTGVDPDIVADAEEDAVIVSLVDVVVTTALEEDVGAAVGAAVGATEESEALGGAVVIGSAEVVTGIEAVSVELAPKNPPADSDVVAEVQSGICKV